MKPSAVAFIPARSGSKRVPGKNIKELNGHPLLAYSICAAIDSGVFDAVICATDNEQYAQIAREYGAEVPVLRPPSISGDKSPDIDWVVMMLTALKNMGREYDAFSILRPTSPFRLPQTISRAWATFTTHPHACSIRAVEKCSQHPGKMWIIDGQYMKPVLPFKNGDTPWHSSQYASLPPIYVQNASLEIAWSRVALQNGSIAGEVIVPFVSCDLEGFDINSQYDWHMAENYIECGEAKLPDVRKIEPK